jgi:hypothetical protein
MKDNFDIHAWNRERYLGKAPTSKNINSKDFDLREWNKKRYLGELNIDDERDDQDVSATNVSGNINIDRGGDDAKMGAELESDENVVGEGFNDRIIKAKLSDLEYDFLTSYFESEKFNAPNPDDSSRGIYNKSDWGYWKDSIMNDYGDVEIRLDNSGELSDDRFDILDKDFKKDKADYIKAKGAALDRIRQRTNFGLDEEYIVTGKKGKGEAQYGEPYKTKEEAEAAMEKILKSIEKIGEKPDAKFGVRKGPLEESINLSDYNEDVERAIDVGINVGSNFDVEDVMYYVHNNWMGGNITAEEAMKKISKYISPIRENVAPNHDGKAAPYGSGYEAVKETLRFIKENNPEFTNEEIKAELEEIKELGNQLNEKLCPKGEAYRKRRMAAGEKSSAYLSGRAVKVCKGQMSGKKKKKKK